MGSSKKQTVGYYYYKDLAGVLCHGPVDAITRIECSDREIMRQDVETSGPLTILAENVFGGKDREGGVSGTIDIMFGDDDQLPNSYMQSKISTAVNAMRGVVSVVWNQLYVGMNPYMRDFKYRVRRTNTGWYQEKSTINPKPYEGVRFQDANLYLTLDCSGVNLANMKAGLSLLLDQLQNLSINLNIKFVGFSDLPRHQAQGTNRSNGDLRQFITNLTLGGATNAVAAFSPAEDFFTTVTSGKNISILVTDGLLTNTAEALSGVAGQMKDQDNPPFSKKTNDEVYMRGISLGSSAGNISLFTNGGEIQIIGETDPAKLSEAILNIIFSLVSATDADINPAHIIRDILTNKRYGLGVPEIKIDDVAFTKMADTLYSEKLGMSILWDGSSAIEDFLNTVCAHICATMPYVDSESGLWTCKLLRDDYDVNTLISLNEYNVIKCSEFTRKTMVDLINTVTVNYWDRETGDTGTVTVDNTARIAQQGKVIAQQVDYDGFTNSEVASRVALRDLKTLSTPLASATLDVKEIAGGLKVGDCFKWSWSDYGLSNAIMRVSSIKRSGVLTNYVTIECIEDSYSMPMQSVLPYIPPPVGAFEPAKPNSGLLTEASYYELVQRYGQAFVDQQLALDGDSGYAMATATTNQNALNATMIVSSGGDFEDVGVVDFSSVCVLSQNLNYTDNSFSISNPSAFVDTQENTYFQVNNELMSFLSIAGNVITVARGIDDTIPESHLTGSKLWFVDEFSTADETVYYDGQIIAAKLLTNTGSDVLLDVDAPTLTLTMDGRANRPYPPANLKINDQYFPQTHLISDDIVLTWDYRNRLQQTSGTHISWFDGSVVSEDGVTYSVDLISPNGTILYSEYGISSKTSIIPKSVLLPFESHRLKVWSSRDGVNSYQIFDYSLFVESVSLILEATVTSSNVYGHTVSEANINVDVDESLTANMRYDGSSIQGKAQPNSSITIEVQE